MLEPFLHRQLKSVDALIHLGDGQAGLERQDHLDKDHTSRTARPDAIQPLIISGQAGQHVVDRLMNGGPGRPVDQIGDTGP